MIKTIFFDFGNVICFFDHQRAVRRLCRYTDLPAEQVTSALYDGTLEDDYEAGRITTAEYVAGATWAAKMVCDEQQFVADFIDVFWLNEPVVAMLPKLARHHRLVLASNTNDAHFLHYSREFREALSPFHKLCTSFEARARKPQPEFFSHCQRFADGAPGECAFVDDLTANVRGAERHGWRGVVYTDPGALVRDLRVLGVRGLDDA